MKSGYICSWHPNGWGLVVVNLKERYFLHFSKILEITPENLSLLPIGAKVTFETAPPKKEGQLPQAINACVVIGGVS